MGPRWLLLVNWTVLSCGSQQLARMTEDPVTTARVTLAIPLEWRHNQRHGVSSYLQCIECLHNSFSGADQRNTSKLCVTGLCEVNSPVTGEFPAQRASEAENVTIWLRHHVVKLPNEWEQGSICTNRLIISRPQSSTVFHLNYSWRSPECPFGEYSGQ